MTNNNSQTTIAAEVLANIDAILRERAAQLALEESIFDGPAASPRGESLVAIAATVFMGLVGIATWTLVLSIIVHA